MTGGSRTETKKAQIGKVVWDAKSSNACCTLLHQVNSPWSKSGWKNTQYQNMAGDVSGVGISGRVMVTDE